MRAITMSAALLFGSCGGLSSELQKVEIPLREIDEVMVAVQRVLAQADQNDDGFIRGAEVYWLVNGIVFELIARFAPGPVNA